VAVDVVVVDRFLTVAVAQQEQPLRGRNDTMLDKQSALERVSKRLEEKAPTDDRWVVRDDKTIEKPFGWIFFYNSEKFLATGNVLHRLAGNGPVFVNKYTESIDFFGSTPPFEAILAEYERAAKSPPA